MLRGYYTAASGMMAQQRNQEMISNNLANARTPGYKADKAALRAFPEMLIHQMKSKNIPTENGLTLRSNEPIGSLTTGVYAQESIPHFAQGPIRETGMPTDFALVDRYFPDEAGGAFFTVEAADGDVRYTRNGHFTVDGQGYLTNNDGLYVLDHNGNRIMTNNGDFHVTPEGSIVTNDGATTIGIAYIDNVQNLVKEGHDLHRLENGNAVNINNSEAEVNVLQHTLESSNVDVSQSMTEMIAAYRVFEQNQRVLKAYDESMGKAVNDIARLG